MKLRFIKTPTVMVHIVLALFMADTYAFETGANSPASRAMGMAGVFSAQADDSSAIWYNPAGLKRIEPVQRDMTVEVSDMPRTGHDPSRPLYSDKQKNLKYAAAYSDSLPFFKEDYHWLGTGVAYFTPYNLTIDIDQPSTPLPGAQNFGVIDAEYHQISLAFSGSPGPDAFIGGTIDYLWLDIECREFAVCVDNGPMGFGASLGVMSELYHGASTSVRMSAVWRSKANLRYDSIPSSGLGTVLTDYTPNRPATGNLGLNVQTSTQSVLINTNIMFEKTLWSDADGSKQSLPDYTKTGLSAEAIFLANNSNAVSLRAGTRRSSSNDDSHPDIKIVSIGAGVNFHVRHFIDLALESRSLNAPNNESIDLISLSYSYQY